MPLLPSHRFAVLLASLPIAFMALGQHLTYREWQERSFRDFRLAPAYGDRPKNAEMLSSDSAFIAQMITVNPDRHACAEHLLDLGFDHLNKGDMVSAMFRFNHAYLMEPKNPRIRRGYGAFFNALDRPTEAALEYQKGLALDTSNVPLMMDMASVCLAEFYRNKDNGSEQAAQFLNTATVLLKRARAHEPKNAEVAFKLSVCHLRKEECKEAWSLHDESVKLGPSSLNPGFTAELKNACPR